MSPMTMPKPDDRTKELFNSVLPQDPRVLVRPMFGNVSGFVNGTMFTGLFGNDVFVRLPEDERAELLQKQGAHPFEPMPGRPMKEYVVLPTAWRAEPDRIRQWMQHALAWSATLPAKAEKGAKPRKRKKG